MKESSEKAMHVINEPRLNVDELQYDIDYLEEVQEITAATTPMKINRPVCVTCSQTVVLKNGCKTY